MSIIDITKTYATRDGREVVIFEVSDRVYCKIKDKGEWWLVWRQLNGHAFVRIQERDLDLIPVKTWRAWEEGEGPKFFIVKRKTTDELSVAERTQTAVPKIWFDHYLWLHEDGTETPCGVCE